MNWIPLKKRKKKGYSPRPFISINKLGDMHVSKVFVEEEAVDNAQTATVYLDEDRKRIGIVFDESETEDIAYTLHYNNPGREKGWVSGYTIACSSRLPLERWGIKNGRHYEYKKQDNETGKNTIFIIEPVLTSNLKVYGE